jgi:hypothetical protein
VPEERRSARFQYFGLVFIAWTSHGERNHVLGRCLDISEHGIGLQLPKALPVGSPVTVQADWLSLSGSATVRHVTKRAGIFVLGLEFVVPLPQDTLDGLLSSMETREAQRSAKIA